MDDEVDWGYDEEEEDEEQQQQQIVLPAAPLAVAEPKEQEVQQPVSAPAASTSAPSPSTELKHEVVAASVPTAAPVAAPPLEEKKEQQKKPPAAEPALETKAAPAAAAFPPAAKEAKDVSMAQTAAAPATAAVHEQSSVPSVRAEPDKTKMDVDADVPPPANPLLTPDVPASAGTGNVQSGSDPLAPPPSSATRPPLPTGPRSARGAVLPSAPSGPREESLPEWEVRYQRETGAKYWVDRRSGQTSWDAPPPSGSARTPDAALREDMRDVPTGPRPAYGERRPSASNTFLSRAPDPSSSSPQQQQPHVAEIGETPRERERRLGREKEAARERNKSLANRPLLRVAEGISAFPGGKGWDPNAAAAAAAAPAAGSAQIEQPMNRWPARPLKVDNEDARAPAPASTTSPATDADSFPTPRLRQDDPSLLRQHVPPPQAPAAGARPPPAQQPIDDRPPDNRPFIPRRYPRPVTAEWRTPYDFIPLEKGREGRGDSYRPEEEAERRPEREIVPPEKGREGRSDSWRPEQEGRAGLTVGRDGRRQEFGGGGSGRDAPPSRGRSRSRSPPREPTSRPRSPVVDRRDHYRGRSPPPRARSPPPPHARPRSRSPARNARRPLSPPPGPSSRLPSFPGPPPPLPHLAPPKRGSFLGESYGRNLAGAGADVNRVGGGAMRRWGAGGDGEAEGKAAQEERRREEEGERARRDAERSQREAEEKARRDEEKVRRDADDRARRTADELVERQRREEQQRYPPRYDDARGAPYPASQSREAPPYRTAGAPAQVRDSRERRIRSPSRGGGGVDGLDSDRSGQRELPPYLREGPAAPARRDELPSRYPLDERPSKRIRRSPSPPPPSAPAARVPAPSAPPAATAGIHPSRLALVDPSVVNPSASPAAHRAPLMDAADMAYRACGMRVWAAVIIATEWDEFKALDWQHVYEKMSKPAFVFDGRLILDAPKLREIGFEVSVIGSGWPSL